MNEEQKDQGDRNTMKQEKRAQGKMGNIATIKMQMLFQGQWETTGEFLSERIRWSNLSLRKTPVAEETEMGWEGMRRGNEGSREASQSSRQEIW